MAKFISTLSEDATREILNIIPGCVPSEELSKQVAVLIEQRCHVAAMLAYIDSVEEGALEGYHQMSYETWKKMNEDMYHV